MQKHLIIEIGTNTVKALKAEKPHLGWRIVSDKLYPCRMGNGLFSGNLIEKDVREKAVVLLSYIMAEEREENTVIHIIATDALRKAENSYELIMDILSATGSKIEIITPDEEASYSYKAVTEDSNNAHGSIAVLDIGGGSTEIITGAGSVITFKKSLPVGAVKLTEQFLHNQPADQEQLAKLKKHLRDFLESALPKLNIEKLTGVGGTVTTLSLLDRQSFDEIDGSEVTKEDVDRWITAFSGMINDEIKVLRGMPAGRADVILAGTVLLSEVMNKLEVKTLTVSTKGVRHGFLYTHC